MFIFLLIFLFLQKSYAKIGLDTITPMSVDDFKCFSRLNYTFYVGEVYTMNGTFREASIQNMKNAIAAGWTDIDAYHFPCIGSICPSGEKQVQISLDRLKKENITYGTFWLDIEIRAWNSDLATNRQFISAMINGCKEYGVSRIGIYSSYNSWSTIVGPTWDAGSDIFLWWARWNGIADVTTGFSPFGGWTKVDMHQYSGDVNLACALDVDQDYKP